MVESARLCIGGHVGQHHDDERRILLALEVGKLGHHTDTLGVIDEDIHLTILGLAIVLEAIFLTEGKELLSDISSIRKRLL